MHALSGQVHQTRLLVGAILEARAIEGTNMISLLVTSSVIKSMYGDSSEEAAFSEVAYHQKEEVHK